MKTAIKFFIPIFIFTMLTIPAFSFAADSLVPCGVTSVEVLKDHSDYSEPCEFKHFVILINTIITFILVTLALPICGIMFVYAGFLMVTSGGSSESRTKAKSIFTHAAIGLVLVAAAWLIVKTVLSIMGYTDGGWIGF